MATNDELREKWRPMTRHIPAMERAQVKVLAEESVWVPLDRMVAHTGIETGYTGDPNIRSNGINSLANCGADCINKGTCSPDLRARGLFQIWCPGFVVDWKKIHDVDYNCYAGAKTLALKYKQCGRNWRAASIAFFAGPCQDLNIIDHSTGTSQSDYDRAMRQNITELNQIGVGTGEDNPKVTPPVDNGNGNTKTDEPSGSGEQCISILGQEFCAPSTGEIVSNLIAQYFPQLILIVAGIGILFVGIKAIT